MSLLRSSPVARFSIISLVTMAMLAAALGAALQRRIDDRALASAAETSAVVGELAVRRFVPPGELRTGLTPRTVKLLDDHLRSTTLRKIGIEEVSVFGADRRLLYSSNGEDLGKVEPPGGSVARALAGERTQDLGHGTRDDGVGAETLEVYLNYGPTAAAARRDVWMMWGLIAGGLVLLWLMLFRLVRGISRALSRQVDENRRQATHDGLTGLPNRALLFERLGAVAAVGPAALLQLDLDGFREINDTLGHDHGDELLAEVATRLQDATSRDDVVARLGGDEFAVVRAGVASEEDAYALGESLVEALHRPLEVRGTTVVIDATVGIALAPQHGTDTSTLARRAEVAMYQGKRRHGGVHLYDPEGDHHNRARLELIGELGQAIRRGELVLAYQPKVELGSGVVRGAEALVRWQHPQHGLLGPGAFIPAAEVTSLVRPLTLHVIDAALRAYREWEERHQLVLPVAVNLAGASVMDVRMPSAVADLLADHGVMPSALTLEISERTMMNDVASALRVLEELRDLGVRLSLDDFGTGQTSLGQLRQLPLDEMKVDRSLVIGDARLLASVVEIAHKFDLRAVGEGVETPEIAEALVAAGCDEAQGFLFARPMWGDDIPAWVAGQVEATA